MLKEIALTNFKPFGSRQVAPLAPITLIYGPNSSGKSSLIQSVLLAKQSLNSERIATSPLDYNGPHVELGDYGSVIHQHDLTKSLSIAFKFNSNHSSNDYILPPKNATRSVALKFQGLPRDENSGVPTTNIEEVTYSIFRNSNSSNRALVAAFQDGSNQARKKKLSYQRDQSQFFFKLMKSTRSTRDSDPTSYLMRYFQAELERVERFLSDNRSKDVDTGLRKRIVVAALENSVIYSHDLLPTFILRGSDFGETSLDSHQQEIAQAYALRLDLFQNFSNEVRSLLDTLVYLGPIRSKPERLQVIHSRDIQHVGTIGEYTTHALAKNEDGEHKVNAWFKRFGINYQAIIYGADFEGDDLGELFTLRYLDLIRGTEVSPADMGFGIGQILPIVVQGAFFQNKIICVEQPELHLHPRLQAEMADLFIETAQANENNNQWIIETHSELVLLRIMKRIREKTLSPDMVSILYVNPSDELGASEIFKMEISEEGRMMSVWPDGFFDEQSREMFAADF